MKISYYFANNASLEIATKCAEGTVDRVVIRD